jgi:hypothetical protein
MTLMEHNEVIIHGSSPDIFANTTLAGVPDIKVYGTVRCTGKDGERCGRLLARVEVARWEQDMASEAQLICKCGKRYTLAQYVNQR